MRTLEDAILEMANRARELRAPAPIIATDLESAKILASIIADHAGTIVGQFMPRPLDIVAGVGWTLCQYDGVKIVVRTDDPCQPAVDGWREHFGPLAEIWSAG